ncbi:MAG: hypothetical protein ACREX3_23315 [Gammaproteobacteria bacterium]
MSADRTLAIAGLVVLGAALVWFFGRAFVMLGWNNVLKVFRDPPFLLALLGLLLVVASYLL